MDAELIGRLLLSMTALATIIGVAVMDISDDHVYRMEWHAHARFHIAAHALLKIALGLVALWLLWLAPAGSLRVIVAALLVGLAWLTMLLAQVFPVDASVDLDPRRVLGLPGVSFVFIGYMLATAVGCALALVGGAS